MNAPDMFQIDPVISALYEATLEPERWRDALQYASAGLPHDFQESPISVNGDGVYLRFLLGVAMQPRDAAPGAGTNAGRAP